MGDVEIHKIGWAHVKDNREVKQFKKKGIEENTEKKKKKNQEDWKPAEGHVLETKRRNCLREIVINYMRWC